MVSTVVVENTATMQFPGHRSMVRDSSGTLWVFWAESSGTPNLRYAQSNDDGATWVNETQVVARSVRHPCVCIDANDDIYVFFRDLDDLSNWNVIIYDKSADSWGGISTVENTGTFRRGDCCVSSDDVIWTICWNTNEDIYIYYSDDHGTSWTNKTSYTTNALIEPVICAASAKKVYAAWMDATADDIIVKRWTDIGGAITDESLSIGANLRKTIGEDSIDIVADSNDDLWLVWAETTDLMFDRYDLGTDSWDGNASIDGGNHWRSPSIAIDQSDSVYVYARKDDTVTPDYDADFWVSDDGGSTWTGPTVINNVEMYRYQPGMLRQRYPADQCIPVDGVIGVLIEDNGGNCGPDLEVWYSDDFTFEGGVLNRIRNRITNVGFNSKVG